MTRPTPQPRSAFPAMRSLSTRWRDNDVYGHVNNVVHYEYFDTAVNGWLIERRLLDIAASPVIALVVETGCSYFAEIAFPDRIDAGLRVAHLGRASVRYEIALFRNDEPTAAAQGFFVHVYVERDARRSTEIPAEIRAALETLRA